MSYSARVLADSVSPDGVRLTTLEVTFPRFILAEVNTHRMLSRNSASSRAIPPEKQIERVLNDPFVPETFNKRVTGMGVGEAIDDQDAARRIWLDAARVAAIQADKLIALDCDKSRINRLLEPFLWHTAIITATEWSNFFALRDHPAAQPEFQIVAKLMKQAMADSRPNPLGNDEWHRPLVHAAEMHDVADEWMSGEGQFNDYWNMISASRCARVSFDKHTDSEPLDRTYERAVKLVESGHLSPFEHVARPFSLLDAAPQEFSGNFRGWHQLRKTFAHEDNFGKILEQQAALT